MVISAAAYLGDELTLKKLPFLTPEEIDDRIKEMGNETMNRFTEPQEPPTSGENNGGDEE